MIEWWHNLSAAEKDAMKSVGVWIIALIMCAVIVVVGGTR